MKYSFSVTLRCGGNTSNKHMRTYQTVARTAIEAIQRVTKSYRKEYVWRGGVVVDHLENRGESV